MNSPTRETTNAATTERGEASRVADFGHPGVSSGPSRRRLLWIVVALTGSVFSAGLGSWSWHSWHVRTVDAFHQECRQLSARQDWDRLAEIADRWTQWEPHQAEPWMYRAEAAEGQKDWKRLVDVLSHVPPTDRRAAASWLRKATVEFEYLNRPWEGSRSCDRVLELDPRVLIAHKQSIFFHAMTLQRTELMRRIRRAIRARRESPESYVYLVSASWLYSASLYRHNTHWLESDPTDETFRVAQAMQIYASEAKQDREVAAEFEHIPPAEELLKQYPHNLELVAFFLKLSISEGNRDRVMMLLKQLPPETADRDPRCWVARAWLQELDGDLAAAEQSLQRAYALDPYWWQVHYQLHDLLRRQNRPEESSHYLKIYEVSHDLAVQITRLNRSESGFDDPNFCVSLLKLAQMVDDKEVVAALRERVSSP